MLLAPPVASHHTQRVRLQGLMPRLKPPSPTGWFRAVCIRTSSSFSCCCSGPDPWPACRLLPPPIPSLSLLLFWPELPVRTSRPSTFLSQFRNLWHLWAAEALRPLRMVRKGLQPVSRPSGLLPGSFVSLSPRLGLMRPDLFQEPAPVYPPWS